MAYLRDQTAPASLATQRMNLLPKTPTARMVQAMIPALGFAFVFSQFLRSVPAVIAPDLRTELGMSAGELSALPSALFLGSAMMQLPSGILLDRYGPRLTVTAFLMLTGAGVVWFSLAHTPGALTASLLVTGWGIAPTFMGIIVLISRWAPRDRLATATALSVGVGGTGMLFSATPFAEATAAFGWRPTLTAVGVFAFVVSLAVLLTVRDRPPGERDNSVVPESLIATIRGLAQVLREPRLYALGSLAAVTVGSFLTFRALWVGPYLNDVYGAGLLERGNLIFWISLAWLASAVFIGPLDRVFDTRRGVVTIGAIAMMAWFAALALIGGSSLTFAAGIMILLGLSSGLSSPIFAHARSLFPDRYVGRVVTAINLFVWGGVFLIQVGTGLLIDQFPADSNGHSPVGAYQANFVAMAVLLLIALVIYRRVADVPPSTDLEKVET